MTTKSLMQPLQQLVRATNVNDVNRRSTAVCGQSTRSGNSTGVVLGVLTLVLYRLEGQYTDSSIFRLVMEKTYQSNECFQSTPSSATTKILKRLTHITTATHWETFLHTQGTGVSCVYCSGSTMCVKPTALSHHRPTATQGSKYIAAGRLLLTALKCYCQKHLHVFMLH